MRERVEESKGFFEDTTTNEIINAMQLLKAEENLDCCPASGVALAGLIKAKENQQIGEDEIILVNLTGGIRKKNIYLKEFKSI